MVNNTAGRPRAVKGMVTLRFDADAYDKSIVQRLRRDDVFRMAWSSPTAAASTPRTGSWEIPRARITAKPKLTKVGERLYMDLEFSGQTDDQVTIASETGDDLALRYALRIASLSADRGTNGYDPPSLLEQGAPSLTIEIADVPSGFDFGAADPPA